MDRLRQLIKDGRDEDARSRLFELARRARDYRQFSSLVRLRRRLCADSERTDPSQEKRVALLGGATTDLLVAPLALAIEATGVRCSIHPAPFNTFAREMLVGDSETATLRPDVAVVIPTIANIPAWPLLDDDADRVAEVVEEVAEHFTGMCRSLHDNAGCEIVFSNFHRLPTRPLGSAGTRMPGEPSNFLASLNRELARRLPTYVHINDVEALAAQHGVLNWIDPRFWHHAKQPVSFQCLVALVQNIAQIIGALFGRSAKCVVVDLDNTLWGGVVGDDGAEGIEIGEGTALGEAFKAVQEYLLGLKERGVLLAVCSKNEEKNARLPFQTRPEMVLGEDDFSAFVANWQPKSINLFTIAEQLNIGTDALVFVDDNPAEREEIRQAMPEVRVVELSKDPAEYPWLLDQTGWMEAVSVSSEDRRRSRLYQEDHGRRELRDTAGDYATYLKSLDQRAVIAPFDEPHLGRITQLTNKTNQFNLTTQRMSTSEIEAVMRSKDHLTAYVRLADRFGDNGLISLVIGQQRDAELWIDLWLMSCRVFGRGVEQLLCNHIVEQAVDLGLRSLRGRYIPTERNGLVREHYPSMGFTAADQGECEGENWRLDIEGYEPFDVSIHLVEEF